MSQENMEIVRQALSALDRRDVEAYLRVASPQIELVNPASSLEGPSIGHEGIRAFFRELEAFAETSAFQVEEVRAVESQVLAFFTLTTRGRVSGVESTAQLGAVYDIEDGKLRRARVFPDRAGALDAVGLRE